MKKLLVFLLLLASGFAKDSVNSMFWIWQDPEIENVSRLESQARDLKAAGFDLVYAMPRATRYEIFDEELIQAVKAASRICKDLGLKFVWGPDPRFASNRATLNTGYGAEMLLVNEEFNRKPTRNENPLAKSVLNAAIVKDGRYNLRFNYPQRRDVHMLTQVALWMNPSGVDKVFAFQLKDGKLLPGSLRDVTQDHHFFINRGDYYVEVFGKLDLPAGEWRVIAFPRFMTNVYAFDAPEHEKLLVSLLDRYKQEGLSFDGFWWDEPGYYFQFGQYPISDRIYRDFQAKYGYDLKEKLWALLLESPDRSHQRVRRDYFDLVMDYVFGAQKRIWAEGEKRFGRLRMGIHHCWHSIPDNMYHGSADYWRGLEAVDGGYTDDNGFERYFSEGLAAKFEQVSYLLVSSSLAKFSRSGEAYYNRWGTRYTKEVPIYFNDLMPVFSNRWIQHAYGYTGVLGASRGFGPGFPDHSTWPLLPVLNRRTDRIGEITHFRLPLAEVAVLYPIESFLVAREPENDRRLRQINRLVGAMPAAGVQIDALSDRFFIEAKIDSEGFSVRGQHYKALVVPCASVLPKAAFAKISELKKAGIRVVFADSLPSWDEQGGELGLADCPVFSIGEAEAAETLPARIEALNLPSPCTRLPGAYLGVLPGEAGKVLLMVMPVEPGKPVSGTVTCQGQRVEVEATNALAIYEVSRDGVRKIEIEPPAE